MLINMDNRLVQALQASTCFGYAHDDNAEECKKCDIKKQCEATMQSNLAKLPNTAEDEPIIETDTKKPLEKTAQQLIDSKAESKTKKASKPKASPEKKATKTEVKSSSSNGMPNFKEMSLEALIELAEKKEVVWKDYGNDQINRMRIIMQLKKLYM